MNSMIEKVSKIPKLKDPILIEGFPGVGNVGRIVVDFLIEKLKPKLFLKMYSKYFPNSVFMDEKHMIDMPKVEFFYYKNPKGRDLVFAVGDVQPAESYQSYCFCEEILDVAQKLKIKEIITLGGISSRVHVENPPVYGACTNKEYFKPLQKVGAKFDRNGTIVIIGVAGLLLGLGKLRQMEGFCLLAETSIEPPGLGFEAAKSILKVLLSYLKIKVPLTDIDKEIKLLTKATKTIAQFGKNIPAVPKRQAGPKELRYIG